MPIPTDTFWNIRRLNWLFAISGTLLVAVTLATILQDYLQGWRTPQQNGRAWEAALVQQKIDREKGEKSKDIAALKAELDQKTKELETQNDRFKVAQSRVRELTGDLAKMQFSLNTLKANVGVAESQLQDARTAKDKGEIDRLNDDLKLPRKQLRDDTEALEAKKVELANAQKELKGITAEVDALKKRQSALGGDIESLTKKENLLKPSGLGILSTQVRTAPLMQFMNPADKVQQVVLNDVLTEMPPLRVPTIDRCTTCHVNIAKKEFTEANVLAYLEQQTAASHGYKCPDPSPTRPDAPSIDHPGATAMPKFWMEWGQKLLSADTQKKMTPRYTAIAGAVGKTKQPVVDDKGAVVTEYKIEKEPTTRPTGETADAAAARQKAIILSAIDALYVESDNPKLNTARNVALALPEQIRAALETELSGEEYHNLLSRYRFALLDVVNANRKKNGDAQLDASPVMLAHPQLDLYVDIDSKHPFEQVGCTSCHDGSGQETNFVLAAHTARDIWVDSSTGEPVLKEQLDPAHRPSEKHAKDLSSMLAAVYPHDAVVPAIDASLHLEDGEKPEVKGSEEHVAEKEHGDGKGPIPYTDPVTGKQGRAVTQMQHWIDVYEPRAPRSFELVYHEWDWPMRTPEYLQANCVRCHSDAYDIKEFAPVVYEGRELFAKMGCSNCHQMDSIPAHENRKVGPDLRHVASKLSPQFINTWVWSPKSFRPSTKMPHFFMLENNSSDEEIRRTRQEARAITEYLVQTSTPLPPAHTVPDGLTGNAENGRRLFLGLNDDKAYDKAGIGCLACHANLNETGKDWITIDLTKGKGLTKEDALAKFESMSYNERQLYVTENLEAPAGAMEKAPTYSDGTPKPVFMHHGPELSGVGTKLLAGRNEADAKAWLFDWLKEPRHYSDYTIMPNLRLSDQQALDLAEYLLQQKRTLQKPDDAWTPGEAEVEPEKVRELTSLFLRSRFSIDTAYQKAAEEFVTSADGKQANGEVTRLAIAAMTSPQVSKDDAAARVEKMSLQQKQLVFLGQKLIAHYGCMSCHAINGTETFTSPCANLSDWGQKSVIKLDYGFVDEHKAHTLPPAQVPMVNGLSVEAANLAHAMPEGQISQPVEVAWPHVEHKREAWLTQKLLSTRVYDRGKNLLEPDLATRDANTGRLADPGKPYDKLRMPTFYLNDEQIHAIVTFVISNRDRLISERLRNRTITPESKQIAKGRALVEMYNCVSCHLIEGNSPQIQQYFKADELTTKAPPSLRGEGNKVQPAWLFSFIRDVEGLRPLLYNHDGIRMPNFPVTNDDLEAIIAYFQSVSIKESRQLQKYLDPIGKYIKTEQENALKPVTIPADLTTLNPTTAQALVDQLVLQAGAYAAAEQYAKAAETLTTAANIATAQNLEVTVGTKKQPLADQLKESATTLAGGKSPDSLLWPGDNWFRQTTFQTAAEVLKKWALDKKQIAEIQVDPAKNTKQGELERNYRTVLFKAGFTRELYDALHPYDTPRPKMDQARFAKGETFFHEMQCLTCHVMGDEKTAGAVNDPKAPNLSLVTERLQRRWVRHWIQEPPIIQVGTAMPPFFTGLSVSRGHGQPWPRSQAVSADRIQQIEGIYGDTVDEQTDLLLDFLYSAGKIHYTSVQPTTLGQPPAAQPMGLPPTATQPNSAGNPAVDTSAKGEPGVHNPAFPNEKPATEKPTPEKPKAETPKPETPKTEAVTPEKPKEESAKPKPEKPAATAGAVSVSGKVLLEGEAPDAAVINMSGTPQCSAKHADPVYEESVVVSEKNELQNVVVYVSAGLSGDMPPASDVPAVLDQNGCMYHPHVLAMQVGQPLVIKNSDAFLHNVHSLAQQNPAFNMAQPDKDPGKQVDSPKAQETFHIKCDVHPWMSAYVAAFDHPYFAVSDESGSFSLKGLPPGEYTLTAWQEKLGTSEQTVTVEEGKAAQVTFKFKPR